MLAKGLLQSMLKTGRSSPCPAGVVSEFSGDVGASVGVAGVAVPAWQLLRNIMIRIMIIHFFISHLPLNNRKSKHQVKTLQRIMIPGCIVLSLFSMRIRYEVKQELENCTYSIQSQVRLCKNHHKRMADKNPEGLLLTFRVFSLDYISMFARILVWEMMSQYYYDRWHLSQCESSYPAWAIPPMSRYRLPATPAPGLSIPGA